MSRVGWRGLRCCTLVLQVIALAFLATSFGAVDPFKTGMKWATIDKKHTSNYRDYFTCNETVNMGLESCQIVATCRGFSSRWKSTTNENINLKDKSNCVWSFCEMCKYSGGFSITVISMSFASTVGSTLMTLIAYSKICPACITATQGALISVSLQILSIYIMCSQGAVFGSISIASWSSVCYPALKSYSQSFQSLPPVHTYSPTQATTPQPSISDQPTTTHPSQGPTTGHPSQAPTITPGPTVNPTFWPTKGPSFANSISTKRPTHRGITFPSPVPTPIDPSLPIPTPKTQTIMSVTTLTNVPSPAISPLKAEERSEELSKKLSEESGIQDAASDFLSEIDSIELQGMTDETNHPSTWAPFASTNQHASIRIKEGLIMVMGAVVALIGSAILGIQIIRKDIGQRVVNQFGIYTRRTHIFIHRKGERARRRKTHTHREREREREV
ncbi:hypothetical protein AAMO2058_000906800 [Amorphochlora amoebiformis]